MLGLIGARCETWRGSSPTICAASPPLHVDGLIKRFGQVTAVGGITLELRSGECLGPLGPNGAGKSTLFPSIIGRVVAEGGKISVL